MLKKSLKKKPRESSKQPGAPLRIVFMGTPDFAVPSLEAVFELTHSTSDRMQNAFLKFRLVGIVTQPDRPVGREQKLLPPPVKVWAEEHQLPVFQPEKLRDPAVIKHIRNLKPDLIVVVAYGQIIPKAILEIPRHGAINVHGSLLPKYRGASPIQAAIAAGETETGITIMLVDAQMDHGPILAQTRVPIAPDETDETLFRKLAPIGARLLVETIPQWVYGKIRPQEQDHAQATYSKLLTRDDGRINWNEPAEVIERKIRAYIPWPGAWTVWDGKRLHILKARVIAGGEGPAGDVTETKGGFAIRCGVGALEVFELQLEGKKPMSAAVFLRGHSKIIGAKVK